MTAVPMTAVLMTAALRHFSVPAMSLVLALAGGSAGAQVSAPITAVILYPGGASVVRTAHVEAGATQLVVPDLANNFSTQNLRVDADVGIRLGQVEIQDAAQTASINPAQASLEARIQELKDQEAVLDAETQSANIVKDYLEHLGGDGGSGTERPRAPMDAKALAGLLEAIGHGASEALAKIQRLAVQKRELDHKVEALQRDLARLRGDARDTRTIVVHLTAAHGGAVRMSYPVGSAGWRPGYRAELDSSASTVRLVRLAQVSQKTGEDWSGVRLVLSTSQPRLSPVAPAPQPWLLSYTPPRPPEEALAATAVSRTRSLAFVPAAAAPAAMAKAADAGEAAYVPPTFQTDGVFATEFELSAPVTLAADGKELSLELSSQALPVRQRVQVTPRVDKTATVTAQADRPSGVWLAGNMQVYRDGNYVGAFAWNPQAEEKFSLPFGRDDLLRVTLAAVDGGQGSTGIFERRNERRIADRITIKSAHATPVDVLVLEASPVSTSDEIKVNSSFDPEPTVQGWEQRRGVIGWERTLKPDETASFAVNYTIAYPKDGTVSGLGR